MNEPAPSAQQGLERDMNPVANSAVVCLEEKGFHRSPRLLMTAIIAVKITPHSCFLKQEGVLVPSC